ncbi:MAG: hypothetical protein ACRDH2_07455 [Anaerolineales bacterium]
MTTTLSLRVTEEGLQLPRQLFPQLGEVEIIQWDEYILIRPKSPLVPGDDLRERVREALSKAGLLVTPTWPPPPNVPAAERAELAHKLSQGRPLSEIVIEDRADRA